MLFLNQVRIKIYTELQMYFVYVISSLAHKYKYVGISSNVDDRLKRHNEGWERTTKPYAPFALIFLSSVSERKTARAVEKYLKSGTGRQFINSLI